jgi:hypothetical protein
MKIIRVDPEIVSRGRKSKTPRLDHKLLGKIGRVLYSFEDSKEVLLHVRLKDGSSISYKRSEDDDEYEDLKRRSEEER